MAKPLTDDELGAVIAPALTGIVWLLKTGIGWEDLPQEMGCGSGMTCWRRLRDWQAARVWQGWHAVRVAKRQAAEQLDWSRAVVDSSSVRALKGRARLVRIPRTKATLRRSPQGCMHPLSPSACGAGQRRTSSSAPQVRAG